jgi:protein phosphatase
MAVEQAWSLDWPGLTQTRREAEEAFRSARIREAVRLLGEAITQLGQAGRLHRKESLNQGWA